MLVKENLWLLSIQNDFLTIAEPFFFLVGFGSKTILNGFATK